MRSCPSCGRTHDAGRDFCDCGTYLGGRDEPRDTVVVATAVEEPPAVHDGDDVVLTLRAADHDPAPTAHVGVDAGGRVSIVVGVRNQSGIVDNYDLRVEGLPDTWWTVVPETLYLLPLGTDGPSEGEAELAIHPPRSAWAEARPWPFEIVAVSRAHGTEIARAAASVTIAPFARIELAVRPQRVRARRRAKVAVALQNRGNAQNTIALAAVDTDDACRVLLPDERRTLGRGAGVVDLVEVRPRRPIIIGRPVERRLEFTARTPGQDADPASTTATFVQRPYLPWWLAIVVPLLAAAIIALLLLRPHKVEVPDLKRMGTVTEAQDALEQRKLSLNPRIERRSNARCGAVPDDPKRVRPTVKAAGRRCPPGTIVSQSPGPAQRVEEGTAVSIAVAVGSRQAKVPSVTKLSAADAESRLTEAGFPIGAAEPGLDPGLVVTAQIPKPGQRRARGTPVNLFLAKPPRKGGKGDDAGDKGAGKDGGGKDKGGGAGGGEAIKVPVLVGLPLGEAVQALGGAKLAVGDVRRVIDPAAAGTVLASAPKGEAKAKAGQAVDLVVSAGFPRLALGDGRRVLTVAGADGTGARTIAADVRSTEPSWTPDGAALAYVAAGRILLLDLSAGKDAVPVPLTPRGIVAAHPAFAPVRGTRVLAFVRRTAGDGDLCFLRVRRGGRASRPQCVADGKLDLTGRPAWVPRGTELVVPGEVAGTSGRRFGLVRYRSATPLSTRAGDWGSGRVVTDLARARRGVVAAAFSPDGTRLAVATNLTGGSFRVAVTAPDDYLLEEAEVLDVPACDVAWRPDGEELGVVIADPGCTEDVGALIRVDPDRPGRLVALRPLATGPAWRPMHLGG